MEMLAVLLLFAPWVLAGGTVALLTTCTLALDAAAWPPFSSGMVQSTGQMEAAPAQPCPGNSY